MATHVALLSREQIDKLPERAREVVEHRKSGLGLNHPRTSNRLRTQLGQLGELLR